MKDCTKIYDEGSIRDLTEDDIKVLVHENNTMASAALRVLGVAFRTLDAKIINLVHCCGRKKYDLCRITGDD
ncbi:MAG: hypothetical protein U0586_11715 [Candidatus Brocadiaceae bacterium]